MVMAPERSRCLVQPSPWRIPGTGIRGTKVEWKAISDFELEPRELKEHQSRDTAESKQVSDPVWLGKVWVCQQSWGHQEGHGFGEDEALVLDVMTVKSERLHIFKNLQTVDPRSLPNTWGPMTSACVLDTRVPVFPG